MQIIHIIGNFLFTIFPELAKDHSLIIPTLENYYTYGPSKPKINNPNLNGGGEAIVV